jgi:hypothetical protein
MFDHEGALDPAEAIQRIPEKTDAANGGLVIGNHVVAFEVTASRAECAQPPVDSALAVEIQRADIDVL